MSTPCFKSRCFGCDLRTGSIIIGCLNAVFSFFMVCVMIAAVYKKEPVHHVDGEKKDMTEENSMTGVYVMSIMLMIMLVFKLVFEVLFIYGVATEYVKIIRSYLIIWILFFVFAIIIFFLKAHHADVFTIIMESLYTCFNVVSFIVYVCYLEIFNIPFVV